MPSAGRKESIDDEGIELAIFRFMRHILAGQRAWPLAARAPIISGFTAQPRRILFAAGGRQAGFERR